MSITYKIRLIGIRVLPRSIVDLLKKVEKQFKKIKRFYYAHRTFSHADAQVFEFNFGVNWMKKGEFERSYAYWEQAKKEGICSQTAYERITFNTSPHFFQNKSEFDDFCKKIDGKKCLEIGSSTEGILVYLPWLTKRNLIDPLTAKYREVQLKEWGRTIFTDDIKIHDQIAETVIPELIGKIDGTIICRNTLDHASDPWKILENMALYAAEGCALLLWTDIWHLNLLDPGHRNIVEDPAVFENKIKELKFEIVRRLPETDYHPDSIHYGCVAIKRATA
jgi:hypothetical protein